jgi:hypothetical protein
VQAGFGFSVQGVSSLQNRSAFAGNAPLMMPQKLLFEEKDEGESEKNVAHHQFLNRTGSIHSKKC